MAFAPVVGATGCSGRPQLGAVAVEAAALTRWASKGITSLGIYNCRKIAGTDVWSVHAEGRAVDIGVTGAPAWVGGELVEWLLGVNDQVLQRVIFDWTIYDAQSPGGRQIVDGNPHTDHAHIELSWPAARGEISLGLEQGMSPEEDPVPMLIVAFRGAQFVVSPDLTSCVGLSQSTDVSALLSLRGGALYCPATLSDSLMSKLTG